MKTYQANAADRAVLSAAVAGSAAQDTPLHEWLRLVQHILGTPEGIAYRRDIPPDLLPLLSDEARAERRRLGLVVSLFGWQLRADWHDAWTRAVQREAADAQEKEAADAQMTLAL